MNWDTTLPTKVTLAILLIVVAFVAYTLFQL